MTGSSFVIDDMGLGSRLELINILLPAITLGIRPLAVIVHLTRNSLINELSSEYVLFAQSKGFDKLYILLFSCVKKLNDICCYRYIRLVCWNVFRSSFC